MTNFLNFYEKSAQPTGGCRGLHRVWGRGGGGQHGGGGGLHGTLPGAPRSPHMIALVLIKVVI